MPDINFVEKTRFELDDTLVFKSIHKYIAKKEGQKFLDENPLPENLTVDEQEKLRSDIMRSMKWTDGPGKNKLFPTQPLSAEPAHTEFAKVTRNFLGMLRARPITIRNVYLQSDWFSLTPVSASDSEKVWSVFVEYTNGKEIRVELLHLTWSQSSDGRLTLMIGEEKPKNILNVNVDKERMAKLTFGADLQD
jgi:hypothetical protein